MREHQDKARALVAKAKAEERDLSDEEQKEFDAISAAMQGLAAKGKRDSGFAGMLAAVEAMGTSLTPNANGGTPKVHLGAAVPGFTPITLANGGILPLIGPHKLSLGAAFVDSEVFKAMRAAPRTGQWQSPTVEIEAAVTITGAPIPPGVIVAPPPPVWPFDLVSARFGQGTTEAGSIPYLQETSFTNAADYVAVGAAKPESAKVFTLGSAPLLKIAHIIKVPDEFLDDVPALRSYIDANMAGGLVAKLEHEVVNGAGGAGKIMGLIALPGKTTDVAAAATAPFIIALAQGVAAVWTASKRRPDTVALSPNTYLNVAGQTSTAGGFLLPNLLAPTPQPLAGLSVVQSPEVVDGTAIIGNYAEGSMLFRKGGIAIQAANTDVDDFQKNITTIRAEMRVALVHWAPAAYVLVTGLTPA
jgi:hypothetical protein